jgi:hypothetical protein
MEPEGYYRAHKSPPLVPIFSQINSVINNPFYISKVHFNIMIFLVVSCMNSSSPHSCYMPCASHSHWFGHSVIINQLN